MHRYRIAVLALVATWLAVGHADPGSDTIYQITAKAVESKHFDRSHEIPPGSIQFTASELAPDGALLAGFEFGLAKHGESEIVCAVRPFYRSPTRDYARSAYGSFEKGGKVTRVVKVLAKLDYAVGGMIVSRGTHVTGISLIFMKIGAKSLTPEDCYVSDWIGDREVGKQETYSGKGAPVIGVFAVRGNDLIQSLGLNYVRSGPIDAVPPKTVDPVKTPTPKDNAREGPESTATSPGMQAVAATEEEAELESRRPPARPNHLFWIGVLSAIAVLGLLVIFVIRSNAPEQATRRVQQLPDA